MPFQYPFRVFANTNLGTHYDYTAFTGEYLASKATGQFPVLPEINLATGNVILKSAFVKTQESNGHFEFGFVYNAQSINQWTDNIPRIVNPKILPFLFKESDGSQVEYIFNTPDTYVSPSGAASKSIIKRNLDGTFLKTDFSTGKQAIFDVSGKISRVYDARGFCMIYTYAGDELKTITSDAGIYTIDKKNNQATFTFTAAGEKETRLLRTWNFDNQARLTNEIIHDANIPSNRYEINYGYDEQVNVLKNINQSDGTSVNLAYSSDKKVNHLQVGSAGPKYDFNYAENNTTITDALEFVTTVSLNSDKSIDTWQKSVGDTKDEIVTLTTQFTYNNGDLEIIKNPDGCETSRAINKNGLLDQQIDADNQTTEFDYDPVTLACVIKRELISGAVNSNPIWAVTRYVYNTFQINNVNFRQLHFIVSPKGFVTEFIYNKNTRQLKSELTYLRNTCELINKLNENTALNESDMIRWACSEKLDSISLKSITENNRGQKAQSQAFSIIDSNGAGAISSDSSNNNYSYTIEGNITSHVEKTDENSVATITQSFDGLQRLLSSNQVELKEVRTYIYNDAQKNVVIKEPNNRREKTQWNDAGQIISVTTEIDESKITRLKSNAYDVAGRVCQVQNNDDQITCQTWDSLNRPRFTVTPTGRMTEITYDDLNRFQSTRHYVTSVAINDDVITYQGFDKSRRLKFSVDGRGAVTEYRYDLLNRKIAAVVYKTEISDIEINDLKKGNFSRTPNSMIDMVERVVYDMDNHIIMTQDAAGYIVSHLRNAAGHEVYRKSYASPLEIDLNNAIVPVENPKTDFAQFYFRDAKGQLRFIVDDVADAHYITQITYYPTGQLKTQIDYANTAKLQNIKLSVDSNPDLLIPVSDDEDQKTTCQYDSRQRLIKKYLPTMRLHEVSFDNMGNAYLESEGDDSTQIAAATTHTTAKRFDSWGQLIAIAPPLVYEKIKSISNDMQLTLDDRLLQIEAVWKNQSERYIYDDKTGLHTAKFDIVPDDVDSTLAINQAKTVFISDADRRVVLSVGPDGQGQSTTHHSIFNKPIESRHYAQAIDLAQLSSSSNGFITPEIQSIIDNNKTVNDVCHQYKYDGAGDEKEYIDPDGFATQTETNTFGDWDKKIIPVNGKIPSLIIKREFNLRRQCILKSKSSISKTITTTKKFDNLHGQCTGSTNGNAAETKFGYEPRGVINTEIDALNNAVTVNHDSFKRETKRIFPGKQSVQSVYSQKNRSVTIINNNSKTQKTTDAFHNVISVADANNNTTRVKFNAKNQWESRVDSLNNTHTQQHDLRGLKRRSAFKSGHSDYASASTFDFNLSRVLTIETKNADAPSQQDKLITQHQVNTLSQRVKTITPANHVRMNIFNLRSLVTEHRKVLDDKISVVTTQDYNAQKKSNSLVASTTTQSHCYSEQTGFDDFGRETSHVIDPETSENISGLALTRISVLDDSNQVIVKIDPKKQSTFYVRDVNGNIRYEINPKGGVTEHRYNADNKIIFTVQYNSSVELSKINVDIKVIDVNLLITKSEYDRQTTYLYGNQFNERFRINRAGAVTETRYDLNNNKTGAVQYYHLLQTDFSTATTEALAIQCAQIRNLEKDKATFRVLDSEGQEVFVFNSDGSVTQKFYYSTLHTVNSEIKYAERVTNPEDFSNLSIDAIQAKLKTNSCDRKSFWIRDNLNRLQFYVNPLGAVTRYDYLADTNCRTQMTEFKNVIIIPGKYDDLLGLLNTLSPTINIDAIETSIYDSAEREITHIDAMQNQESWHYDGASRKSTHKTLSGHAWIYDYDGANRLVSELSPLTTVYSASIDIGNVTDVQIKSESIAIKKTTQYDANSNITAIVSALNADDEHAVNFAYNALNQKILDHWPSLPIDDLTQETNLFVRPEKIQSVSRSIVSSAHGAKLITFDENNTPEFYAYNAQGQLIYRVNALGYVIEYQRNGFGQAECFIAYATQLTLDLSSCLETGLTMDVIAANLRKEPENDSSVHQVFDQCGRITAVIRDAVITYIPDADKTKQAVVSLTTPTTQHQFNAFGEVQLTATLISGNVWRQNLTWYDQCGNEIASVDANGIATVLTLDARGRKTGEYHYANRIPQDQFPAISSATWDDLKNVLLPLADTTKDRNISTPRDILGRITGVYHVNVITQEVNYDQHSVTSNAPATVGITYTYTADGKIKSTTYPNQSIEINYYDERGYLAAKTGVKRTQAGNAGIVIRPITYYHINAHGECVETFSPIDGCSVDDFDPASNVMPAPLSIVNKVKDRYERFMRDAKNHILLHQDSNKNLKHHTFNATGKVARKYKSTTVPDPKDEKNLKITHVEETQHTYDALNRLILSGVYRDAIVQSQHAYLYDAFTVIAEGPGDGTFPIQHHHDQAGRKWLTVTDTGAPKIIGRNAAGDETVTITSLETDLSIKKLTDLPAIMANRDSFKVLDLLH
ncbi:MAG: hypothetical protein NTZ67_06110 [Gammaproteobacteria bacterium]|nr:hypothetical protein [Gammaproteobacteria bacterium]